MIPVLPFSFSSPEPPMKRISLVTLAAIALPLTLSAQQQQGAAAAWAAANPITASYRGSGANYARWLQMAFDSIPESKYGYKPMPVQQSVGYIAQHLENANYQLCSAFSN